MSEKIHKKNMKFSNAIQCRVVFNIGNDRVSSEWREYDVYMCIAENANESRHTKYNVTRQTFKCN